MELFKNSEMVAFCISIIFIYELFFFKYFLNEETLVCKHYFTWQLK